MTIKRFTITIRNTILLYTMAFKVLREYSIFILAIMALLSSCQLTNTGENNKSVLNEDLSIEEKEKISEKEALIERSDDDISEKSETIC